MRHDPYDPTIRTRFRFRYDSHKCHKRTIMARRPRIEVEPDGSATVRTRFQPTTWRLIAAYAAKLGVSDEDGVRILLQQIDALVVVGSLGWLSMDWQALARELRGKTPSPASEIDTSKLHRSDRVKSGYHGVYANGQGFRAVGPRGAAIVTCKTAEEAAWRRYLYYREHGLAYGELELLAEDLRKQGERGSEQQLRALALETAKLSGTLHLYADQMTSEELTRYGGAPSAEAPTMAGFAVGELEIVDAALDDKEPH